MGAATSVIVNSIHLPVPVGMLIELIVTSLPPPVGIGTRLQLGLHPGDDPVKVTPVIRYPPRGAGCLIDLNDELPLLTYLTTTLIVPAAVTDSAKCLSAATAGNANTASASAAKKKRKILTTWFISHPPRT